jgi:micrococcal nuclease
MFSDRRRLPAFRRARVPVLVAALLACGVLADRSGLFGRAPEPDRPRYHDRQVRVERVVDGDTLVLALPDPLGGELHTRVRLWGVDTPETVHPDRPVQHFGPEAGRRSRELAEGREVRLELLAGRTRDRHDRLLAYVFLPDGRMLNRVLIEEGFGYADPRFAHPRSSEFRRLQNAARDRRAGLWREVRREDLPYYLQGYRLGTEGALP